MWPQNGVRLRDIRFFSPRNEVGGILFVFFFGSWWLVRDCLGGFMCQVSSSDVCPCCRSIAPISGMCGSPVSGLSTIARYDMNLATKNVATSLTFTTNGETVFHYLRFLR